MPPRLAGILLILTALAGCSTAPPIRYHQLAEPAAAPAAGSARLLIDMAPIHIPEGVNREEMVIGETSRPVQLRDDDHWAAPLADEVGRLVMGTLWRRLGAVDINDLSVPTESSPLERYRLALRIERFQAVPGGLATVEASWMARRLPDGRAALCRAAFSAPDPDALADSAAAALSTATSALSEALADTVDGLQRGVPIPCPTTGGSKR